MCVWRSLLVLIGPVAGIVGGESDVLISTGEKVFPALVETHNLYRPRFEKKNPLASNAGGFFASEPVYELFWDARRPDPVGVGMFEGSSRAGSRVFCFADCIEGVFVWILGNEQEAFVKDVACLGVYVVEAGGYVVVGWDPIAWFLEGHAIVECVARYFAWIGVFIVKPRLRHNGTNSRAVGDHACLVNHHKVIC